MRRNICFALLSVVIFAASCQRETDGMLPDGNNPTDSTQTPDTTAHLYSNTPKQIKVFHPSADDPINITLSIQYDTPARMLKIFSDDSTTVTPYDHLAITYTFNAAGYLLGSESVRLDDDGNFQNNGQLQADFTISRNSSNQIEKIVDYNTEEINGTSANDTITYRYYAGGSLDSIMVENNHFITRYVFGFDKNQILKWHKYYDYNTLSQSLNYEYDAQNNISRIYGTFDTTEYSYAATQNADLKKWPEFFLGKDAYLLQQDPLSGRLGYNFLSFIIENKFETIYNPMFTQPLARIVVHGRHIISPEGDPIHSEVKFATTYTADGKIKTITATPDDDDAPIYYTFSY